MNSKKQRESGIELLKIIAMVLIVISHVNQTLGDVENEYGRLDYIINHRMATTSVSDFVMSWMTSFGAQGNLIFFICSAWFLLESKSVNYKKVVRMIADVWVIHVSILLILELGGWYSLSFTNVVKSLFPTTCNTNWYITCYLLFYLIHAKLNQIIESFTQKELLTVDAIALALYYGVDYAMAGYFFASELILFLVMYVTVAYLKKYLTVISQHTKFNLILLIIGISGTPLVIALTNLLGLYIPFFSDKLMHWSNNASPFLLLTAIALFNLFRKKKYVNVTINKISSLSLLVYIIHENVLLRRYVRPQLWMYIYEHFGYSYVVLWVLALALGIFVLALIVSYLYQQIFQRMVHKISDGLGERLNDLYERMIGLLLKIN